MAKKKKKAVKKKAKVNQSLDALQKERQAHWKDLREQRQRASQVLSKYREELLKRENVTGLHIGFKRTGGEILYPLQYVLIIHVRVKRAEGDPLLTDVFDGEIDGVATDIVEMSYRKSQSSSTTTLPAEDRRFHEILQGGIAIAPETNPSNWGTLGMVVYHFGQPMFLTNQHVALEEGALIRQPPFGNKAEIFGETFFQQLSFSVDCAIIGSNGSREFEQLILGLPTSNGGFIEGQLMPQDENITKVFKIGAKTGFEPLRVGVVESIAADVHIPDHRTFIGQILVRSITTGFDFIEPGDSGSVLVKEETHNGHTTYVVVGLVHSETEGEEYLVASHFYDVARELEISINNPF